MFKSWTPTFWINLGSSYDLILDGIVYHIKPNSAIAVTRAATAERVNLPTDYLFTVKFFPGALKNLIDVDQTRINSGIVDLSELLSSSLIWQIKTAGNFDKRKLLMEEYLLQNFAYKKGSDHFVSLLTKAIGLYTENGMQFNLSEISQKIFTGSRTLRRYFDRVIGICPKQYFESVKIRMALPSFLNDRKSFEPTAFGFYDKSHFYRSVLKFTGKRIVEHQ